jgi:hypothetical protein
MWGRQPELEDDHQAAASLSFTVSMHFSKHQPSARNTHVATQTHERRLDDGIMGEGQQTSEL